MSVVRVRPLRSCDAAELKSLHLRLFPVEYPDGFFEAAATGGEGILGVAATLDADAEHAADEQEEERDAQEEEQEEGVRVGETRTDGAGSSSGGGIVGFITAKSVSPRPGEPLWGILPQCRRRGLLRALQRLFVPGACPSDAPPDDARADADIESRVPPDGAEGRDGRVLYIMTLGVREDLRRRGVAADLVRTLLLRHGQDNHCCVCLHVIHYNTLAQRFYRKLGFRRVQVIDEFYTLEEHREPVKVRERARMRASERGREGASE